MRQSLVELVSVGRVWNQRWDLRGHVVQCRGMIRRHAQSSGSREVQPDEV
jgi:hypothetical protein